jgi:mono/diheme cytochrome c family protein
MTARARHAVRRTLSVALVLAALGAHAALAQSPAPPPQASGDARRGAAVFTAKQCARCHGGGDARGVGPTLQQLRRRQGAWELAGRLWNHTPSMFTTLKTESVPWPEISSAEMADLMAYLQADPALDPKPDRGRGRAMLAAKGCLKCHAYRGEGERIGPDLGVRREEFMSASRFAARMWRHTPQMAAIALERGILYPRFSDDEMAQLVGYLRTGGS